MVKKLKARGILDAIVTASWETGDPGVLFLDHINEANPTPNLGEIENTNPCGEVPLLPYESCVLGSINLSKMVKKVNGKYDIDFEKIKCTVRYAIHFLDNVIDMNKYPLLEIKEMTEGNRKIGLGVMGFAHFLIHLQFPYDYPKALEVVRKVMSFIQYHARERSKELAEKRSVFKNFNNSIYNKPNGMRLRNATITTIAPTGTLSLIANCSGEIEPLFGIKFRRKALEDLEFEIIDPLIVEMGEKEGFFRSVSIYSLSDDESVKELPDIPPYIKSLFRTSFEISPKWHIKIQAAFQEFTDNAVSKTINFPKDATKDEIKEAFLMAYKEKCKGITIYRSGSKQGQVLVCGSKQTC